MTNDLDPYHKWLGIPPTEQPPNHYRLMGIPLFETDRQVVRNAADRCMSYLKSLSGGAHSRDTQQLLNELAAAKVCLLSLEKKTDYDISLKRQTLSIEKRSRGREFPKVETGVDVNEHMALPLPSGSVKKQWIIALATVISVALVLVTTFVLHTIAEQNADLLSHQSEVSRLTSEVKTQSIELYSIVDLSNASEEWTKKWCVINSRQGTVEGGTFRDEPEDFDGAYPPAGRPGILYLHPEKSFPAEIWRVVTLESSSPVLKLGVSGNRKNKCDWDLRVTVNGQSLENDKTIAGSEGWQDLSYSLKEFSHKTVLIEILAGASGWYGEYVFIDYINIQF